MEEDIPWYHGSKAIIDSVESGLRDPNKLLTFQDPRTEKIGLKVAYQRAVGSMSPRELFIYKYAQICQLNKLLPEATEDNFAHFYTAALYGDGKGLEIREVTYKPSNAQIDETIKNAHRKGMGPASVSDVFQIVLSMANRYIAEFPDTAPFSIWCKAEIAGKSGKATEVTAATLNTSKVFTQSKSPYGLPVGRSSDGAVVSYFGNRSMVTIAPPESGKTMAQALPSLLNFAGHVFVLDIKGHLHEQTAVKRQQTFNSRIINFNPGSPNSAHYNPLLLVSDDPDDCYSEADILAQLILPVRNEKDASWETMGQRLLAVFIAYTVLTKTNPEQRTMSEVLNLVAGIGTAEAMTLILSENSLFPNAMKRAANTVLKVMDDRSHAQFTGILQALDTNLSIWNKPQVERGSDRCDWLPEDFRSNRPLSVYFTIPLGEISTYAPLIRVITAQHVFRLMREIPATDSLPILFLLDEFPQLGRMDPVKKAIEFGREFGIKTWLFAQFTKQFEDTYGQAGGNGMIEICGVRMYMNPPFRDAEAISKEVGSQTSLLSEKKQPIMPVEEITGPASRDSVFVLSSNETPLVLSKNFPPR